MKNIKIAIAGPGRSGTTFLVQFLKEVGFTVPPGDIHKDANAGLESRIGGSSPYEVDKDPWCFEYIERIPEETLLTYAKFIVPIRNLHKAAISRSVQERYYRALNHPGDLWRWDSFATVAGGAISDTSRIGIERTLLAALWKLLECLAKAGIQPTILYFPRLALDFEYLWSQIGTIISVKVTRERARNIFLQLSDTGKIRATRSKKIEADKESLDTKELSILIEMLRQHLNQQNIVCTHHQELQDEQHARLTEVQEKLHAITSSRSWRITRPLRILSGGVKKMLAKLQ